LIFEIYLKSESFALEPLDTESIVFEPLDTESIVFEPLNTESVVSESLNTESIALEPLNTEYIVLERLDTESIVLELQDTESVDSKPLKYEYISSTIQYNVVKITRSQIILLLLLYIKAHFSQFVMPYQRHNNFIQQARTDLSYRCDLLCTISVNIYIPSVVYSSQIMSNGWMQHCCWQCPLI